jgi:hypothetical protein
MLTRWSVLSFRCRCSCTTWCPKYSSLLMSCQADADKRHYQRPLMDIPLHLVSAISALLCKKCATISVFTAGSQFILNMKGTGTP